MNKALSIFLTLIVFSTHMHAQKIYRKTNPLVKDMYDKGSELYAQGDFMNAAKILSACIKLDSGKVPIEYKYQAASAWSMAKCVDSAFDILFQIAPYYKENDEIKNDSSFANLRSDRRWIAVLKQIDANKDAGEANIDHHLKLMLDTILHDDQDDRKAAHEMFRKEKVKTKNIDQINLLIAKKDSINVIKVRSILKQYGWPDVSKVGEEGEITIFLVIQHAKIEVQKELSPQIEVAYQKGYVQSDWYATFLDKIAINDGHCQIYGSQVRLDTLSGKYHVSPLIEVDKVDSRRSKLGLGPITAYLKFYNIDWATEKKNIKSSPCK